MGKARGAGPRPSVGKLTGGSKGRQGGNIKGAAGQAAVVPNAPALSGAADVVQQRTAQATQGVMEKKQLKKNKSAGLRARRK